MRARRIANAAGRFFCFLIPSMFLTPCHGSPWRLRFSLALINFISFKRPDRCALTERRRVGRARLLPSRISVAASRLGRSLALPMTRPSGSCQSDSPRTHPPALLQNLYHLFTTRRLLQSTDFAPLRSRPLPLPSPPTSFFPCPHTRSPSIFRLPQSSWYRRDHAGLPGLAS
jgi:hypothetical protein